MFFYDEWKIKYLFEIPVLNSKAIKEVKEIELLEEYLHFEYKKIGTARILIVIWQI
jgi:hypothetical protein